MSRVDDNLKDFLNVKSITNDKAVLYFYGDIVSSWWGAWDDTDQYPESVKNFLIGCENRDLEIHINSGGGSVFAGITIYNMLKNFKGHKTVYIDGLAASIASVIALAGDEIIMRTGSSLMIHKPSIVIYRDAYNADELKSMAESLDTLQECIMQVYKENLKDMSKLEEIEQMVNAETWMTSEEAMNYFDIKLEELEAVACKSDVIGNFIKKPKFIEEIENKRADELKKATAKLNLLKLGGNYES